MQVQMDGLVQSIRNDYKSLDPCISIAKVWHTNDIRITQIKCGEGHIIVLDTKGKVYLLGRFHYNTPLSHGSLNSVPFQHQITEIRSGYSSVACKDTTKEWYVWGLNTYNHITGLCGCETTCKEANNHDTISNPMQCEWQSLFNASRVIDLQLGRNKAHVIVDLS